MKSFTRSQNARPVPHYVARPEASRRACKRAALRHQIHWAHFRAQESDLGVGRGFRFALI